MHIVRSWTLPLLLALLAGSTARDFTFTFELPPGRSECFYDYIHEGAFLEIEYQVCSRFKCWGVASFPGSTPQLFFARSKKNGEGAWAPWYVTRRHVRDVGCLVLLNQITRDVKPFSAVHVQAIGVEDEDWS